MLKNNQNQKNSTILIIEANAVYLLKRLTYIKQIYKKTEYQKENDHKRYSERFKHLSCGGF